MKRQRCPGSGKAAKAATDVMDRPRSGVFVRCAVCRRWVKGYSDAEQRHQWCVGLHFVKVEEP